MATNPQPMFFLNLPVKDLGKATTFYEGLGYSKNTQFSDENASSMVISDTIVVMLLAEPFFKTFTTKGIADTSTSTEALLGLSAETREAVDALVDKALGTAVPRETRRRITASCTAAASRIPMATSGKSSG